MLEKWNLWEVLMTHGNGIRTRESPYASYAYRFHPQPLRKPKVTKMRSSLVLDIMRRGFMVTYRRFVTTYKSHFQGSRWPILISNCTASPLKMGAIGLPETSLTTNLHCETYQNIEDLVDHSILKQRYFNDGIKAGT
jgi:hypothetical protein